MRALRWGAGLVVLVLTSSVLAENAPPAAPPTPSGKWIIPQGREGFIKNMLTPEKTTTCKGTEYKVVSDYVVAEYDCTGAKKPIHTAVELHHPSAQVTPIDHTEKFVLAAHKGAAPLPEDLKTELVAKVRAAEPKWTWTQGQLGPSPDAGTPPTPAAPKKP